MLLLSICKQDHVVSIMYVSPMEEEGEHWIKAL